MIYRDKLISRSQIGLKPMPEASSDTERPQLYKKLVVRNTVKGFFEIKI